MSRTALVLALFAAPLVACGGNPPPETQTAANGQPSAAPSTTIPEPPTSASAMTSASAATPAEPSPEEKAKAEAQKQLANDRAKAKSDHDADVARWTPDMHAAAKAAAEKDYPNGKSALQAMVAGKWRKPENSARDKYRHPVEMMDFFGFKPTMQVLEYGPGAGWFTELLAPALAKKGKLFVTSADINGPKDVRPTFYAERLQMFLDTSPELFGKVEKVIVDDANPKIGHDGQLDMVLVLRGLHGMVNAGKLEPWLEQIFASLKPGGVLAIEEHRAKPGADPIASAKKGYLPQDFVIQKAEAAGFKLAAKSEMNANPKDTTDWPEGVWTLPPTLRLGDKDKDKYLAVGESDRMTLKFVKPNAPAKKK